MDDLYNFLAFWTLIIKGVTFSAVLLLLVRLIYKNRKRNDSNLRYLIFMFIFHEITFAVGLWASLRWFVPDFWIINLYNDDIRVWVSIISLGLGSVGISYFTLNTYYTGRYEKLKKVLFNFNLILILLMAFISTIFFLLNITLLWIVFITSGSIFITYMVSLLGWIQTRLNINEDDIEDYDSFIRRFKFIGIGTLSLLMGSLFYFADRFAQNIDPAVSILLLVGYILVFIGIMNFYFAFYISNNNQS